MADTQVTSSITITEHAKHRWLERQQQLEKDDINSYLALNDDKVCQDIITSFNHAEKVYRGQLGQNHSTADYYLLQDIIFVYNSEIAKIITIYKIDYGMPYGLNKTLQDSFYKALKQAQEEQQEAKSAYGVQAKKIQKSIAEVNAQINGVQNQLDLLQAKKRSLDKESDNAELDVKLANNLVQQLADKLLYSKDYFDWDKQKNLK